MAIHSSGQFIVSFTHMTLHAGEEEVDEVAGEASAMGVDRI